MAAFISFLEASAEAYEFEMRTGMTSENRDLFSNPRVAEWAFQNVNELSSAAIDLSMGPDL